MEYKLVHTTAGLIEIPGLINLDAFTPDTRVCLILGLNHALDSIANIFAALYSHLYDEYQCNNNIKDGDTFTVEPFTYERPKRGDLPTAFDIPAWQFVAKGVDILPVKDSIPDFDNIWLTQS